MHLVDIIPDSQTLLALTPEELGLAMLPSIQAWARNSHGIELSGFLNKVFGPGGVNYPTGNRTEMADALREAWAWLEGAALIISAPGLLAGMHPNRVLSRRARQLVKDGDPRRTLAVRSLPKMQLFETIREDVWQLFQRGKYDTAVFEAMKAVEIAVREAGGFGPDLVGVGLMSEAFKAGGPLADPDAERGEQVALMNLFQGAIGSFKNPHSHRKVALGPDEAAEILLLATHLLRIVAWRRMLA